MGFAVPERTEPQESSALLSAEVNSVWIDDPVSEKPADEFLDLPASHLAGKQTPQPFTGFAPAAAVHQQCFEQHGVISWFESLSVQTHPKAFQDFEKLGTESCCKGGGVARATKVERLVQFPWV